MSALSLRRIRPEIRWTLALLVLPIAAAVYLYLPKYAYFTAMGEIVSIRDIGVSGSVHFVYVREGFTRNRFERFSVGYTLPDAEFQPAEPETREALFEEMDLGADLRNETIRHALDSAEDLSEEEVTPEETQSRLEQLQEETARYYGDSIGLMLGIGLVEESEQKDYSQDGRFVIAGTGTLEEGHQVGSVGAIRDKLRTAEAADVDYFFVPRDKETFLYEGLSNEEESAQVVEELGLRLQVVPVATLEEALDFLRQLN